MTETSKRITLCCAIGWFLGGGRIEHYMAALGILIMVARIVCFDEDGARNPWLIKRGR